MNWKDFEGCTGDLIGGTYQEFAWWGDWGKPREAPLKEADILAEVRSKQHSTTGLESYSDTSLLGDYG
jgi:hypothetical protein